MSVLTQIRTPQIYSELLAAKSWAHFLATEHCEQYWSGRADTVPIAVLTVIWWILEYVFPVAVPRYVSAVQFHRLVHRLAIPVCH